MSLPPPSRRRGIALAIAVFSILLLIMRMGMQQSNRQAAEAAIPTLTLTQEVALGQTAAPAIVAAHGGISHDATQAATVKRVGEHLASTLDAAKNPWKFEFQLLAEPNVLDAYALPGGQIFITTALLNRLQTEGQLAAILAQQIAHVNNRHVAKQLKALGLTTVLLSAAGGDPITQLVPEVVKFAFTADQELVADREAAGIMSKAGYNPNALTGALGILSTAYYAKAEVAYFTTHPNAQNRLENITSAIAALYPTGAPATLSK